MTTALAPEPPKTEVNDMPSDTAPETNLSKRIREAAGAGFGGIWVRSAEHEDATNQVADACLRHGWTLLVWDAERGTQTPGKHGMEPAEEKDDRSVMSALNILRDRRPSEEDKEKNLNRVLLVMRMPHLSMFTPDGRVINPKALATLQNVIEQGEDDMIHVVALANENASIPVEVEKHFFMIDHNLPTNDELWELVSSIARPEEIPEKDSTEGEMLLDAMRGLTRMEVGGALGLSITRLKKGEKLDATSLREMKKNKLNKTGLLTMYEGDEDFSSLGGLNAVKEFVSRVFNSPNRGRHVRAKGIGLVGVPGTGKSAFIKAVGNEVGWPTLMLDIGALFGGIVGQTEANTRTAQKLIESMQPCVIGLEEVEKAFSGAGGSGGNDSGVTKRLFGSFLNWLADRDGDIFVVFTANDIASLLANAPEFARAGRFDGLFFLDMPSEEQRDIIWNMYIEKFKRHGLKDEHVKKRPDDSKWTGAEIESCVNLATLLDVPLTEAAKQVIPVSTLSAENIDALREWATNRCLSADYRGVFDKDHKHKMMKAEDISVKPLRRRVTRRGS